MWSGGSGGAPLACGLHVFVRVDGVGIALQQRAHTRACPCRLPCRSRACQRRSLGARRLPLLHEPLLMQAQVGAAVVLALRSEVPRGCELDARRLQRITGGPGPCHPSLLDGGRQQTGQGPCMLQLPPCVHATPVPARPCQASDTATCAAPGTAGVPAGLLAQHVARMASMYM